MLPNSLVLLPLVFPLLGAVIFALPANRAPRLRSTLPIVWLVVELAAILANIAPGVHLITLAGWDAANFSIAWRIDGVNLLLLATLFVPLLALWLIAPPNRPLDIGAVLVLTGAASLLTSANPLTIYISWVLFDLALFAWRTARAIEPATILRGVLTGQFAGMLFLAGAILSNAGKSEVAAPLIALALWARLGVFPFHFLLPSRGVDHFDLWFVRGVPFIAGANLWLHWSAFQIDVPFTLIGTLAAFALSASAIWIWREETPGGIAGNGAGQALALVPLAITFGREGGVALGLWLTLAATLALALFEIALRWRAENLNRWARLIWFAGLFTLAGLPLTPAFLGRLGVYVALWESTNGVVMFIAGLATLAVLIPIWRYGFAIQGSEPRDPRRIEYIGLAVMLSACGALAFIPMPLAHALGAAFGNSAERALDLVIHTDDVAGVGLGIVVLVLAVIGSFIAQSNIRAFYLRLGAPLREIANVLDLEWVEQIVVALGKRLGLLARGIAAITEENPTVWLLFAALWVAIFVMILR